MKNFLIFILCLNVGLFLAIRGADAKAYKLGRGRAYSITGGQKFGEFERRACAGGCLKCSNGICETCPTGLKPNGSDCVDYCKDVVCKAGKTAQASGGKCCCVTLTCPSGQRARSGRCEDVCADVVCLSGKKRSPKTTSAVANKLAAQNPPRQPPRGIPVSFTTDGSAFRRSFPAQGVRHGAHAVLILSFNFSL